MWRETCSVQKYKQQLWPEPPKWRMGTLRAQGGQKPVSPGADWLGTMGLAAGPGPVKARLSSRLGGSVDTTMRGCGLQASWAVSGKKISLHLRTVS